MLLQHMLARTLLADMLALGAVTNANARSFIIIRYRWGD